MSRTKISAAVLAALLTVTLCACSEEKGGGEGGAGGAPVCELGDQTSPDGCSAPSSIAGVADLQILFGTQWPSDGWGSVPPTISGDLVAGADLALDALQIGVPANCLEDTCAQSVIFRKGGGGQAPGVTIADESTLQLEAGASFRVLAYIETDPCHPGGCLDQPTVLVYRPCTQPCDEGEIRCSSDMRCRSQVAHCQDCLDRALEVCACYTFCGSRPNGSECTYNYVDILYTGHCQQGTCEYQVP